ncbi:hypothetical protein ACVIWV_005274 [Bradyrhizobium diazoefficiens]|jgi:hypothetical protein|nr:hypothetical protein BJA5080_01023 [Bradyrhizobium diazoefficiens SEMIA 5080]BAR59654.1 hypothetical protein NK6_6502 [Bradyrhizobium diazoefficiens]
MEPPSILHATQPAIAGSIGMNDLSRRASSDVHAHLATMEPVNTGTFDMGKVVFLYRSLAYRNAAADMLRKARKLPRGAERSAARRYAMALRDLAQTEAWLEGRIAHEPRPVRRMKVAASG